MHKARLAGDLVGNVETLHGAADDMVGAGKFGFNLAGGLAIEQVVIGERPVSGQPVGAAHAYGAVGDFEVGERHFEPRCRGLEVNGARLGAGVAQRGARFLHRHAARGHLLVGAGGGACGHHAHPCKGDVEFLGGDLRQRGDDALADFDLARIDRHIAVGVEFEPLAELAVDMQAARQSGQAWVHLRQFECEVHAVALSFIMSAARSTARTIRLWLPQRHRCLSSASRTWASLGRGLFSRNAAAVTRIPEMQ